MKLPNFDLFGLGGENSVGAAANDNKKEDLPPFREQLRTFTDKIKTKFKKKKKSTIVLMVISGVLCLYIIGVITTFIRMFASLTNGINNIVGPSFNPITALVSLFDIKYSIWALVVVLILSAAVLFWYIRNHIALGTYTVENRGGAEYKKQKQDATLGSAREMNEDEIAKEFLIVSESEFKNNNPNTLLYGILPETGDYVMQKPKPENAPDDWAPNLSAFICGDSGSYKTTNFIIPAMGQLRRARRNIICTDLSGEVFKLTYNDFKKDAYNIRVFNTMSPEHSDTWNFIGSVGQNIDLAKTITQTIQQATELPNSHSDEFFTRGMNTLLPALILYVNEGQSGYENSIRGIMKLIMDNSTVDKLEILFDNLDDSSEAKIQYKLFEVCPVRDNFLANLAQRLDLFVSRGISRICSADGINLVEELGVSEKPTIIYVITNKTYGFISALFLSSAAKLLEDYSNRNLKNHVLPNSLFFVYEEFLNQGYVPNMVYNMQNLRKFQIYFFLIVQSIPNFEQLYTIDEADAILENCKYKLLFGAGGPRTAEKFEKFCGPTTVRTEMTQMSSPIIKTNDQIREGIQQRSLYDYNELMNFKLEEYLLFVTHCYPLRLKKPFYKLLPGGNEIEEAFFMEYTPKNPIANDAKKMEDSAAANSYDTHITKEPNKNISNKIEEQINNVQNNSKTIEKGNRGRKPKNHLKEEDFTTNLLNIPKNREVSNKDDVYRKVTDGKMYFKRRDSHGKELNAYKVVYDIPPYVIIKGEIPNNEYVTYHTNIDLFKLRENCKLIKDGHLLIGWRMERSVDGKYRDYLYDNEKTTQRFVISVPQSDITITPLFKAIPGIKNNQSATEKATTNSEPTAIEMSLQDEIKQNENKNSAADESKNLPKPNLNTQTAAFDL